MNIVYFEGDFLPESEAKLPLSDRGFQHGDGVYATLQVRNGTPLFLEAHLDHLEKKCGSLYLTMGALGRMEVEKLVHHNQAFEGIWRLKIFITGGDCHDNRLPRRQGRTIMVMKPFAPLPFKPLCLGIFPIPYWSCHASFKSLAHLNRLYVMEEAYQQGLDDCITQTESGYLLEASFGNLFWVDEKTLYTPDPSLPLYFGITLTNVLNLARKLGFEVIYAKDQLSELPNGASIFRTNTMQGIRPVVQIGSRLFQRNEIIETLFIESYEELIRRQKKLPLEWGQLRLIEGLN